MTSQDRCLHFALSRRDTERFAADTRPAGILFAPLPCEPNGQRAFDPAGQLRAADRTRDGQEHEVTHPRRRSDQEDEMRSGWAAAHNLRVHRDRKSWIVKPCSDAQRPGTWGKPISDHHLGAASCGFDRGPDIYAGTASGRHTTISRAMSCQGLLGAARERRVAGYLKCSIRSRNFYKYSYDTVATCA